MDRANRYIALAQRLSPYLNIFIPLMNNFIPVVSKYLRARIHALSDHPASLRGEQGNFLTAGQEGV
jgi:hypothetical protein